jgi:hypothetical protein
MVNFLEIPQRQGMISARLSIVESRDFGVAGRVLKVDIGESTPLPCDPLASPIRSSSVKRGRL